MIDVKRENESLHVLISGGLTAGVITELKTAIVEALKTPTSIVMVDLTNSEMIDSKGLGLLIAIHNTLSKTGGKLKVTISSPAHWKLFQSMRLDQHFDIIQA